MNTDREKQLLTEIDELRFKLKEEREFKYHLLACLDYVRTSIRSNNPEHMKLALEQIKKELKIT